MNPDALGPKPLGCVEELGDFLVSEEKDGSVGHHAEEVRKESAVQPAHAEKRYAGRGLGRQPPDPPRGTVQLEP